MERESFTFHRSFYEAVKDMPKDIRLEVFTAIMEYALYGRQPEALKPFANSIFTLIKPSIDVSTSRYENGKKGGRKSAADKKQADYEGQAEPAYATTYEQEVDQMKTDLGWRKTICEGFGITEQEYDNRLSRFLMQCNRDKQIKGKTRHDSFEDCKRHLRYWMAKVYATKLPTAPEQKAEQPHVESDSFGGVDYDEK